MLTRAQKQEQIEDLQGALNTQANVISTEGQGGNSGFTIRGLNSEGLTNNQNPAAAPLVSVVIDGATHYLPLEFPEVLDRRVRRFEAQRVGSSGAATL